MHISMVRIKATLYQCNKPNIITQCINVLTTGIISTTNKKYYQKILYAANLFVEQMIPYKYLYSTCS
jgi:hypothetical protein